MQTSNVNLQVSQFVGPTTTLQKAEGAVAKALGRMVSVLSKSDNPQLQKINSCFKEHLEARNEIIDRHNTLVGKDFSKIKNSQQLQEMYDLHTQKLEKSDELSPISNFLLNGVREHLNEAKATQRKQLMNHINNRLQNNLSILYNATEDKKGPVRQQIAFDRSLLKTLENADFKQINAGKAKEILLANEFTAKKIDESRPSEVILRAKSGMGRQEELNRETEISQVLQERLIDIHGEEKEFNLLKMQTVKPSDPEFSSKMSLKRTEQAGGDLQGLFKTGYSLDTAFSLCKQVVNGMSNLHQAGFLHGDFKDENVLFYPGKEKGEYTARISDYGKTREFEKGESFIYPGNYRFAPPEGRLSEKGEVYSTALLMVRILENELLENSETGMVTEPTNPNSDSINEKRLGIEKFLIANEDCPQTDRTSLSNSISIVKNEAKAAVFGRSKTSQLAAEEEVHRYIKETIQGLSKEHPEKAAQLSQLEGLLKEMTRSDTDPKNPRLSDLAAANARMDAIMNS